MISEDHHPFEERVLLFQDLLCRGYVFHLSKIGYWVIPISGSSGYDNYLPILDDFNVEVKILLFFINDWNIGRAELSAGVFQFFNKVS